MKDWPSIYRDIGYKNRMDYLECLAKYYDVPLDKVMGIAAALGLTEDFDALVEVNELSEEDV